MHEAGRLRAGDYVYIFAAPKLVHLLDRLFARPSNIDVFDREFFGDFVIDPSTRCPTSPKPTDSVLSPEDAALSAAEFIHRRLQGTVEIGDRVPVETAELIIRQLDDKGEIASIGLAVEPSRTARPKLPVVQSGNSIRDVLARWRNRLMLDGASR